MHTDITRPTANNSFFFSFLSACALSLAVCVCLFFHKHLSYYIAHDTQKPPTRPPSHNVQNITHSHSPRRATPAGTPRRAVLGPCTPPATTRQRSRTGSPSPPRRPTQSPTARGRPRRPAPTGSRLRAARRPGGPWLRAWGRDPGRPVGLVGGAWCVWVEWLGVRGKGRVDGRLIGFCCVWWGGVAIDNGRHRM